MTKMTYVLAVDTAINALTPMDNMGEVVEKLIALKASLVKRNSADKKPTKTQMENEGIKNEIMALMADGQARTVTEIMKAVPTLVEASNQKAANLVRQLKDAGELVREEIKRKAYFKIA